MATYVKGFKKQKSEQFLLKAIVGLILVVLVFVGVAFIYDLATDNGDYADFALVNISSYDAILTQKDEDLVQIPNYLVYFYNADDAECLDIQREVLKTAAKLNADGKVIFFVNLDTITVNTADRDAFLLTVGKSTSFLNQSPMLVSVVGGVFSHTYTGATEVLDVLDLAKAGEYFPA